MKKLIILPVLMLIINSCRSYQINVLSSTNMQKDPDTGNFITENDSVKITYSFFGRNAPIYLEVYNKLNEPIYIDWQRSDFITNDKAVSYANDKVHVIGNVSGTTIGNKTVSISNGSIDAVASLPKTTEFIPPHAHIGNKLLEVTGSRFSYLSTNGFEKKEISSLNPSGTSSVKIIEFGHDQSPLSFKSYLTLYTLNNNVPKFKTYEHIFYLSKIIKTAEQPENFDFYYNRSGDCFITSKNNGFGKAADGVGLATVAGGIAALNKNNEADK